MSERGEFDKAMDSAATFQEYRALLFSIAYRMLGSADEADDVLQDAFVRFQAATSDEIRSPKAFLSTIVTRLCLNQLKSARATHERYVGQWLPEPVPTAELIGRNDPERHALDADSISIAFMTLLQNLTPAERAVFVLHEVFDYGYGEIAGMLEKSEPACRQLFSRAKRFIAENRPRFRTTPEEHRRILEAFMRASASGDLEGLTAMLTEDAVFWADGGGKIPGAALKPIRGRAAVVRFVFGLTRHFLPAGATFALADVNGRPTVLVRNANGSAAFVVSVEIEDGRVESIWAIANPDKLHRVDALQAHAAGGLN